MSKEVAIYIVNGLVAVAVVVIAGLGKVSWIEASMFIGVLLTPSAVHAAMAKPPPPGPQG